MIRLGELKGAKGSTHRVKRLGRGVGSGKGNTSGKGHKGLLARKGGGRRIGYEGGQTPMIRRIPKRGFHNFTRIDYEVLNLSQLAASGLQNISIETLREAGVVRGQNMFLKILSVGEVTKVKSVKAHKVSAAAKAKLEKAGATVEIIVPEVINVRG